jgi:hypothetical protein
MVNTNLSYRYFLEKASSLLYSLLVGEGDARSRLKQNEMTILFILALPVPEELKLMQKEILTALTKKGETKVGEHVLVSAFQNTITSMRNSTASNIIAKISSLYTYTKCNQGGDE